MTGFLLAGQYSLAAALISLDGTALLQVMLCQPLIACPLLGFVFGQAPAGLSLGLAFQLLYIYDLPVGSHLPKDASLMALCALGAVIFGGHSNPALAPKLLAPSALLAVAFSAFLVQTSHLARRANGALSRPTAEALRRGRTAAGLLIAQAGLICFFGAALASIGIFTLAAGRLAPFMVAVLPGKILLAMDWTYRFMPVIGAAHFIGAAHSAGVKGILTAMQNRALYPRRRPL